MNAFRRGILAAAVLIAAGAAAEELVITKTDWESVKQEIADLRQQNNALKQRIEPLHSSADSVLANKYGPGANVTAKTGKLTISGVLQVWYYSIQTDRRGLFDDHTVNNITDVNDTQDNSSFRIRRSEIRLNLDLNENISTNVMIDPAREAQSFPSFPDNQGSFKRVANSTTSSAVTNVQTGAASAGRALQDAYINYHGYVPHHDFQIGQFKPAIGEEGIRSSAQLDFAEKSFLGQLADARDLGASLHGTWEDERLQYWVGAFDSAGNFLGSGGQAQNRSDDNSNKDLNLRLLTRPIWNDKKWGNLELGVSGQWGRHGERSSNLPIDLPVGLNRRAVWASRWDAWASYFPGGPVSGLWLRGEWAKYTDRNIPGAVISLLSNDLAGLGTQDNPNPVTVQGWYAAMGYRISDSRFRADVPKWLRPCEFLVRYDTFQNVEVANLIMPDRTDVFATNVWTAGLNYYLSGNTKLQVDYNFVENPSGGAHRIFHNVRNDSLLVNFQVAW